MSPAQCISALLSEVPFLCFFFSVRVIDSAVLEDHVTVPEMSAVNLSCSTTFNQSVWWKVRTVLHGEEDRRFIYRLRGFVGMFRNDRRFAVEHKDGIHKLTITNTTVTDAGEYQCIEDEGMGPASSIVLYVFGKIAWNVHDLIFENGKR
jgi:hypothetical protein